MRKSYPKFLIQKLLNPSTFNCFVETVPVFSNRQVCRITVSSPEVDALILRPRRDVFTIRTKKSQTLLVNEK